MTESYEGRARRTLVSDKRPGLFILVVLIGIVGGAATGLRSNGIFACQSANPDSDQYLAYCQATGFGDYDHGAFWFELEAPAIDAASDAEVLFLGNSRLQFGLSSEYLDDWFESQSISYYLLGFSHMENYTFTKPLLAKLAPSAGAYVINVDLFFEDGATAPANDVMTNQDAPTRYAEKRRWQILHGALCGAAGFFCGDEVAFYRSRSTGAWVRKGGDFHGRGGVVSYDDAVDHKMLSRYQGVGIALLDELPVSRKCVILTNTPQSNTTIGTARVLADELNLPLVAPRVDGLMTFDGSHLDVGSAARWSTAFVETMAPHLHGCLNGNDS